MPKDFIP